MGRLLETLKQAEAPRRRGEEALTPPAPERAEEPAWDGDPDVPFIEVGPRKEVEASPGVLAGKQSPRSPLKPELADAPVALVPDVPAHPAEPRKVSFHPVPQENGRAPHGARISPELVAYHQPDHPASAQYRQLLTCLTSGPVGREARTLFFTSVIPGGGTSTVVLNLAITAAKRGQRLVVVDANPRRPGVAWRLGLPEVPGLREVLAGSNTLEQALRATAQDNLFVLTSGAAFTEGGLRFASETVRSVLRRLRQRFEWVLVDGPAWDGLPEPRLPAACDAALLVVPETEAESPHVDELLVALPDQGVRLAGCILAG